MTARSSLASGGGCSPSSRSGSCGSSAGARRQRLPPSRRSPERTPLPDYFAFESRMRGDTGEIRERQREYVEDFREAAPVLDLGCGRGEFLALLAEAGIEARGIDADADMVAYARGEGLDVEQADALAALEALEDGSLGGVFAAQLLEHLPPPALAPPARARGGEAPARRRLRRRDDQPALAARAAQLLRRPDARAAARPRDARAARAPGRVRRGREALPERAGGAARPRRTTRCWRENVTRLNELLFAPLDYAIVART